MISNSIADQLYVKIEAAIANNSSEMQVMREFRVILESLYRQLTITDNRSFSNLYGRIEYVHDKLQVTGLMKEQVNSLRILTNKCAHDDIQITRDQFLLSLKTIALAVNYFSEVAVPSVLRNLYAELGDRLFVREQARPVELIEELKVLILSVGPMQQLASGTLNFTVHCREESIGDFDLQLWQSQQNDLSVLQPILKPWQTLNVINCRKTAARENHYSSGVETQIVLEPDLLLDISELAECFGNNVAFPSIYFLKKLLPQTYSLPAFQGNMVNTLLDECIRSANPDFKPAFQKAVAENVFQAAVFGREKLNEVYKTIKEKHWNNVVNVTNELRGQQVRIEPTFYSAKYGLQGRLDLLVEDDQQKNSKDIYELKSGNPPDNGTWKNNQMQVVGYNMLLKSTFGKQRTGSSAVLYSASTGEPLRNVTNNILTENDLLRVRNEVVAGILQLASGNYECLELICRLNTENMSFYSKADQERFCMAYSTALPLQKTYYKQYISFIFREWLNTKCGIYSSADREEDGEGFAALWLNEEYEKQRDFNIINSLSYKNFDAETSVVTFDIAMQINHNFRPGDTVLLYPRTNEKLAPLQQQIVKARLDGIQSKRVEISLNNRQLDASYFSRSSNWVLEHDIYESSYWTQTRALFNVLLTGYADKFKLVSGTQEPQATNENKLSADGLNENQVQIIQRALAAKDYYLIQGPPGTGKTSTILTRLTQELLKKEGAVVLVAFTNRAVDEIATRLKQKNIEFIRLGSRQSEAENHLRELTQSGDIVKATEFIKKHRIFLGTVATMSGRLENLRQLRPDLNTLIVDEASQLTEPQVIGMVLDFKKFILVGDQNQLPPVVAQDDSFCTAVSKDLQAIGISDLRVSLFERLMKNAKQKGWHHCWRMLNTHFRMHKDIAGLINHWYGNQLVCGTKEQENGNIFHGETVDDILLRLNSSRTVFIPSPTEATPKYHRTEAERVVKILKFLRKTYGKDFTTETVGVVTPWRTQIGLIRQLIGDDEELQQLHIDTVERFQGSENDIIIVSMAVFHPGQLVMLNSRGVFEYTDANGGLQKVDVDRKMLVTLSRAKKQVVVLGDERVMKEKQFD